MAEDDIDISTHTSNHVDEYKNIDFDLVLTVCDHAREVCPYFPTNAKKIHHNFPDPAKAKGTEEEIMNEFRNARNLIKDFCQELVKVLKES
jgi:arsenate reductase